MIARPGTARSELVAAPPGAGDGFWAGAPSSALDPAGGIALAYRVRAGHDGGDRNVIAHSDDGVRFDTLAELPSAGFGARGVEKPTLLPRPDGGWRLYTCLASPRDPSWWVVALDAPGFDALADADPQVVMPADAARALKDPLIRCDLDGWRAWVCAHLLDVPGEEDRMRTDYATSGDGLSWTWHGPVLCGRPGEWDARGTRVTAVLDDGTVHYDGRAGAAENWFERSGVARPGADGPLHADPSVEVIDVRYVDVLTLPSGSTRLYYEARRPDGSHELHTELVGDVDAVRSAD